MVEFLTTWVAAQPPGRLVEYGVIAAYLVVLVAVAFVFKRFNENISDYFRNGCKATWWLVGMSCFMASFSAWTFTGAAGVAYENGWSILVIFIGNTLALLLNAAFLAPWFRQLRAISGPDVISMRFGVSTQQFYAWLTFLTYFIGAALQLYALAAFCSAVFGYSVGAVIVFVGCVVLFYSLLGGSWAVMATDFIQSLILIPMTVVVAWYCLRQFDGGAMGFLRAIQEQGLTEEFRFVKPFNPHVFIDYSWVWIIGMWLNQCLGQNAIGAAPRYFAVKDGRDARKAALIAAIFMGFGSLVWFIPPMTARLLFAEAVEAAALSNPADAAYAIASMRVLPLGMTGLMVVAMFAATMSSMDTGLNRNAAVFTNDIYPALCRLCRGRPWEGRRLLFLGELYTLLLGGIVIFVAYYLSTIEKLSIFVIMQMIGAILGSVLVVPMFMGLFFKRAPWWAALVSIVCAAIPSFLGYHSGKDDWVTRLLPFLAGYNWPWYLRVFLNLGIGALGYVACMPFWRTASPAYRAQVEAFFETMHRPVDFAKEVGAGNDLSQLKIVGAFCVVIGAGIALLLLLPNPASGRLAILAVAGSVVAIGGGMMWAGRRRTPKTAADKGA
ncbi:MAG: hypothetical protein GX595_09725 [Lentisphaerae bacterium]|nr:hypothetical protein [Lentisphaerota bacterium]